MISSQSLAAVETTPTTVAAQSLSAVATEPVGAGFLQTLHTNKIVITSTSSTKQSLAKCSICLEPEFDDEAKLDGCAHHYCFECIYQWSKATNSCPQCKSEFTTITHVNLSGTKRTRAEQNGVLKVKRRKQRADYDEEELQRLGYIDDEADDDDDDNDDDDDGEEADEDNDNGIAGYSNDGFVVTNDVVEYDDDDEGQKNLVVDLEDDVGDDESVDDEEDSDESSCSTSSEISLKSECDDDDDDDDDIQIVKATNGGRVVPIVTLRSQSSRLSTSSASTRRSLRISCMAN